MYISIDFNSNEALYLQLRNQIILAIVKAELQEGYLRLDRRRGAVVAVDMDKVKATMQLAETLDLLLAQAICKKVERQDVHELVDQIYDHYDKYRD